MPKRLCQRLGLLAEGTGTNGCGGCRSGSGVPALCTLRTVLGSTPDDHGCCAAEHPPPPRAPAARARWSPVRRGAPVGPGASRTRRPHRAPEEAPTGSSGPFCPRRTDPMSRRPPPRRSSPVVGGAFRTPRFMRGPQGRRRMRERQMRGRPQRPTRGTDVHRGGVLGVRHGACSGTAAPARVGVNRRLQRGWVKDPDGAEPTRRGYTMQRVVGIVFLAVAVWILISHLR
ncbi:DUF6199 family natural product biosynthesis protein [Kitasatospora sp. NPDC005751]|uniref:DUF6199 family natural product biosynthesis protein n=1 Tax=Kitasatospora sp. NPDC005751 TaxID=3157064 RepID=UPI0033C9A0D1